MLCLPKTGIKMGNRYQELEARLIFKIEDKRIRRADADMYHLNGLVCRLIRQDFISKATIDETYRLMRTLAERISGIEPEETFDKIVKDNITSSTKAIDGYLHYFHKTKPVFTQKRENSIVEMLAKMYGEAAYTKLRNMCKSLPHDEKNDYGRLLENMNYEPGTNDIPEFREKANNNLPDIERMLEKYMSYLGFNDGIMQFDMNLVPFGYDFSFWDGNSFKVFFDPEKIIFYRGKNKTKTYRGHWYLTGIHEFVGHALQQKFSEKMPLSLRCGPKNFNHITGGTNSEGAAMFTEIYSMDWFNQKSTQEFLNLGRDDMRLMNVFVETYLFNKTVQAMHDILEAKERQTSVKSRYESVKDSHEELSKITGMHYYEINLNSVGHRDMNETIEDLSYVFGTRHMKHIWTRFKRHIWENYNSHQRVLNKNKHLLLRGMLSGQFRSDVQYEFLTKVYLPR